MIKGVYLNELTDDCEQAIRIQKEVFGSDYQDEISGNTDHMPILYILLFGNKMQPVGSARMTFSLDGTFLFDQLSVLAEERQQGYGDFMMHMIFDKCQLGQGVFLKSQDIYHQPEYFEKYGFEIREDHMILNMKDYFLNHKCKH